MKLRLATFQNTRLRDQRLVFNSNPDHGRPKVTHGQSDFYIQYIDPDSRTLQQPPRFLVPSGIE